MDINYDDLAKDFANKHEQFNNSEPPEKVNAVQSNADISDNIPDDVKSKVISEMMTNPSATIRANISSKVQEKIKTDESVQSRLDKTAENVIDHSLTKEENKVHAEKIQSENDINQANFTKYQNEYSHFGIESKVDKLWKTKIITFSNDFWFIILALISFFTIVPVSIFIERLRALKGCVKIIFGIIGVLLGCGVIFSLIVLILHFSGIDIFSEIQQLEI